MRNYCYDRQVHTCNALKKVRNAVAGVYKQTRTSQHFKTTYSHFKDFKRDPSLTTHRPDIKNYYRPQVCNLLSIDRLPTWAQRFAWPKIHDGFVRSDDETRGVRIRASEKDDDEKITVTARTVTRGHRRPLRHGSIERCLGESRSRVTASIRQKGERKKGERKWILGHDGLCEEIGCYGIWMVEWGKSLETWIG